MKKSAAILLGATILLLAGMSLDAQELPVIHVKAQQMIVDKNPLRYIPLNIISNNDAEVFAANVSGLDLKNAIVAIELSETTEIDSVTFKAGYFDARYYSQNDRIKRIKLEFYTAEWAYSGNDSLGSEEFTLTDEMKAQTFKFKKKYKCSKIELSALELIKGDKWDDLVITNVSFSNNGKVLTPTIKPNGSRVSYYEDEEYYSYDNDKRLVHVGRSSGKAGGSSTDYIYKGGRVAVKLYSWDGLDTQRTLMFYQEHEEGKLPIGEETFSYDGALIEKKVFTYSGDILVQENINNGKKIIKYTYSGNNLISEEWTEGGKVSYVKTYFYENGICVAEYQDYKTKDGLFRKWLYKNYYENGKLKTQLLVYFADDSRGSLSNASPVVYDYIYKDGILVEKNGGEAW